METYHIYPTNDLKLHNTNGPICDCNPSRKTVNGNLIIVHNAWDGREWEEMAEERIINKMSRDNINDHEQQRTDREA